MESEDIVSLISVCVLIYLNCIYLCSVSSPYLLVFGDDREA